MNANAQITTKREGDKLYVALTWDTPYGRFQGNATVDLLTVKRDVTAFLRQHGAVISGPVNVDKLVHDTAKRRACRKLRDGIGDWEKGPETLKMRARVSGLLTDAQNGSENAQNTLRAVFANAQRGNRQAVAATRMVHEMKRTGDVGFSFKSITNAVKSAAKSVKGLSKTLDNPIASALISQVPGGAAIVSANKIARTYAGNVAKVVQQAKKDNPEAVQAIAQVARAAAQGDQQAKDAVRMIQAVNTAQTIAPPVALTPTHQPPLETLRATPPEIETERRHSRRHSDGPFYPAKGRGPIPDDFEQVTTRHYYPLRGYLHGVRA